MPDEPECFIDPGSSECPVCGLVDLMGRKWTLHLLWALREEERIRFNELKRQAGDISPRVLTDRLNPLVEADLVERREHDETPPRVEYALTENGQGLDAVFRAYMDWADRFGPPGPPDR